MKFTILALFCILIFVEEMSGAPAKDKKKSEKKNKTEDKPQKKTETTDTKEKKQYIPGATMYGNTYGDAYSTGYSSNPYNTGASTVSQEQQDIFNKPVQLVQIKDLDIKNGVIKGSDVVQG